MLPRRIFIIWAWSNSSRCSNSNRQRANRRRARGNVLAARWQTESSAPNADLRDRMPRAGPAPAEPLIRANSVRNAEKENRRERRSIAAINAAGSRRIPKIRLASVPNAATVLTKATKYKITAESAKNQAEIKFTAFSRRRHNANDAGIQVPVLRRRDRI